MSFPDEYQLSLVPILPLHSKLLTLGMVAGRDTFNFFDRRLHRQRHHYLAEYVFLGTSLLDTLDAIFDIGLPVALIRNIEIGCYGSDLAVDVLEHECIHLIV